MPRALQTLVNAAAATLVIVLITAVRQSPNPPKPAPAPPANSFDATAADRGKSVFESQAKCATCHVPPLYTEPGWAMHKGAEIGLDELQAERSPDRMYRTTPLRGLFTRMKDGLYHDGRFATLDAVVEHYDKHFDLKLNADQKRDLVEFLKSL